MWDTVCALTHTKSERAQGEVGSALVGAVALSQVAPIKRRA